MARGDYERLTPEAVDLVWVRLKAGYAAKPTARELGLCTSTMRDYLMRCGGIQPSGRRGAPGRLSLSEREEISRGLAARMSVRSIAASLARAASTVSREVTRNGGRHRYRAAVADRQAWARAARPKRCKLAGNPVLRGIVATKLRRRWSPQQIAGWLKATYPDVPELQVSHESIYRTLPREDVQSRGALRRELTRYLRTGRAIRRPQGVRLPDGRGGRPGTMNISQRPAEANDRAVPGHWEGDLVFGKGMSPIATLVERSTRFVMLVSLPRGDHQAAAVADALSKAVGGLPKAASQVAHLGLGSRDGSARKVHRRYRGSRVLL